MSNDINVNCGISDQAVAWFARLRSEDVSEQEVAEFNRWLELNPDHQREFNKLDSLWISGKDLQHAPQLTKSRQIIAQLKDDAKRTRAASRVSRTPRAWLAAAIVVVAVAAGWWQWFGQQPVEQTERFFTRLGELKTIALDDGTTVTLNTRTALDVTFLPQRREVHLLRGQASFDVAYDRDKPFVVTVGNSQVKVLGTVFDIYKQRDKSTVTLLEGVVEIAKKTSAPDSAQAVQQRVQLKAGQQVDVLASGEPLQVKAVELHQASAWHEGKMSFNDTPLSAVIDEANRYSELKLQLADKSISDLPITGIFSAGQSENLAGALKSLHGLGVEKLGDWTILIYPNQNHIEK